MTLNKKSRSIYKKSRRTRTHGTRKRRISCNRLRYLKRGGSAGNNTGSANPPSFIAWKANRER